MKYCRLKIIFWKKCLSIRQQLQHPFIRTIQKKKKYRSQNLICNVIKHRRSHILAVSTKKTDLVASTETEVIFILALPKY